MISRIALGSAPSSGDTSVTQCTAFKRRVRDTIGSVESAHLLTVKDEQKMGVEVVYESGNPVAEAWAQEAQHIAESVWKLVARSNTRQMLRG